MIEGALASSAAFVAVIDADLQHDETRLPVMLRALEPGPTTLPSPAGTLRAATMPDWVTAGGTCYRTAASGWPGWFCTRRYRTR